MKLNHSTLFRLVSCLCFTAFIGCNDKTTNSPEEVKTKKPNIVFILADDLGAHDLSFAGSDYYETPNLDGLAKEGIQFSQGYAAAQVCSPSRASILTGQYTPRHGVTDWIGAASGEKWGKTNNTKILPPEYSHAIASNSTTIAEALKEGGYKTFFAGKWHLGHESNSPENYGFDINIGGWEVGNPKGGYYAPWNNPKLDYKYEGESLTMRLAQETADFISEHKDGPFFAYLSFYAVHTPLETSKKKWEKYRNKAESQGIKESGFVMERNLPISVVQDNPMYAGLVETMDDAVGVVLERLKELNLDENTIIVFTSDNGGLASSKYGAFATTNLPLRGGKGYQWEGGIREPYLIKAPMYQKSPGVVDYPVSGIDFYPTLLDVANVEKPKDYTVDGISLVPLLKGESVNKRALYWHYPHYGNQGGEPVSIIRKEQWKLIHYWEDRHDELYNLDTDPGESKDLLSENEGVAKEMKDELFTFLESVDAKFPENNASYDDEKAKQLYENRKVNMTQRLEQKRQELLRKDFDPKNNWFDSGLTRD